MVGIGGAGFGAAGVAYAVDGAGFVAGGAGFVGAGAACAAGGAVFTCPNQSWCSANQTSVKNTNNPATIADIHLPVDTAKFPLILGGFQRTDQNYVKDLGGSR